MKIIFVYLFLNSCVSLFGQTATLQGVITDSSGAGVASASIVLKGSRRADQTAVSGSQGEYTFLATAPGTYTIQASAPQLNMPSREIKVTAGSNIVNLQLSLATVRERVDVSEDSPGVALESDQNAAAKVIKGDDLAALGDSPEDLVTDLQALAGPSAGPGGAAIYVDGFSGGVLPPKETIREVRINQNPFSPEYDKLGLGRIEILTKPGSESWHGTLTYNHATDAWNTRNPYSIVKAPLLLNEFENTLGGRLGKRASLTLDVNRNSVDNGSIVNAVRLDLQTLAPAPLFDTFRTIQRRTNIYPRIDYQLNERNTLSLRYAFTQGRIDGAGIGGFNLTERGEDRNFTIHTVQGIETAVLGAGAVNETRFQYYRDDFRTIPRSDAPALQVLGAFNAGGTPTGRSLNTQSDIEVHNISTVARGKHTWRFGVRVRLSHIEDIAPQNFNGTFTFGGGLAPILDEHNQPVLAADGQMQLAQIQGLERYRRTLLFQQLGYSSAEIRKLGGGATQFTLATGAPGISGTQTDAGVFLGDDWRLRPNLTISYGLRFEAQTNLPRPNAWAPRMSIAWAPGKSSKPKTVLRMGAGVFYDRFALNNTLTAQRYDGLVQQQFVVTNPDFFQTIPPVSNFAASPQVTREIDASLRTPTIYQGSFTVEHELWRGTTLAITYTGTRGVHFLRSLDINAPLPGTSVFPLGNSNPVFLSTSSGVYNQNQLGWNVTSKVTKTISLSGSYTLNRARGNTDGLGTSPANPYNYAGEYGPAATDIRHQVSLNGTINTRWSIRLNPSIAAQSGSPFDITTGSDLFGTTLFNARPGVVLNPGKPGLIPTPYGFLDPNPVPGQDLLSRNSGRGPGQVLVNLRVGKTIALGNKNDSRYNATISLSIRNLLNHTNPGPIVGNITSPLFGRANQTAGSLNGEGFSENASNRRLEMQVRVTF